MDRLHERPDGAPDPAARLPRRPDRYEQLVFGMSDLLLVLDAEGRVGFTNRPPRTGSAHPRVGDRLPEALGQADRAKLLGALDDVFSGRAEGRRVFFRLGANGEQRVFEGELTPIVEDGRVAGVEFLGRDITDRIHSLQTLHRRQEELRRDLAVAAKIQESLMPQALVTEHVLIDLRHIPLMSVGGDYVHIDRSDPLCPTVAVFDVAGHGVASALVANRVHSSIVSLLGQGHTPVEMIRSLNRFVYHSFSDLGLFVTLLVMRFDFEAGQVCFCGAGHPPALLRRGDDVKRLTSRHLPVGVVEDIFSDEPQTTCEVQPGDLIWIYTDGLMELRCGSDRMLGVKGLEEALRDLDVGDVDLSLTDRSLRNILSRGAAPNDDVTLVTVALR